jgi:hypothetical protein
MEKRYELCKKECYRSPDEKKVLNEILFLNLTVDIVVSNSSLALKQFNNFC